MDAIKVNTPEELHQAIGEFLQSDYSRENLIMVYDDARKSANRFRVTYSALPKVPTYNNDPLDGIQEIGEWCDKSVKLVDDIVSDLNQQTINETIRQLKKIRGFADSVLSLVDTKLKEQAQKEARAKVEKEYKKLNDEASKTKGMLLLQREEVVMKLGLEAQAILRRETEDVVQIYLSKDPTFKNRISQQDNEIDKVLERLNKLIGSDTPTGKLLDLYCKLKSIPLQRQFDDVEYAYFPIDDWADVICGGCNRLYTSIDNVIKTFEEIKAIAQKDEEAIKKNTTSFKKHFVKTSIKHLPRIGPWLFDLIYGVDGVKTQKKENDSNAISEKQRARPKDKRESEETGQRPRDSGDTYIISDSHVSLGDKAQHAGRDITTQKLDKEKGGWELIKKITLVLTIIVALIAIYQFAYKKEDNPIIEQKMKESSQGVQIAGDKIDRVHAVEQAAKKLIDEKDMKYTHAGYVQAVLILLEEYKDIVPDAYARANTLYEAHDGNKSKYKKDGLGELEHSYGMIDLASQMDGILRGLIAIKTE